MHWAYKLYSGWTWDNSGLFDRECKSSNIYDCINNETVFKYARTYPRAVAGDTVHFTYNETTGDAYLKFTPNKDCTLPTEIFASETWVYKDGFEVEIEGDLAQYTKFTSPQKDIIHITVDKEAFDSVKNEKTVDIFIKSKKQNTEFIQ